MEQGKVYRISLWMIAALIVFSVSFSVLNVWALIETLQESWIETLKMLGVLFAFPLPIGAYSIYLWRKRKEGAGFYWDEEGIVIDLKGNKVYWDEIEDIRFSTTWSVPFSNSTVIYPHYTNHEKIRARRKKWMPTTAHSIDWILIEKPEEYHKNLMKIWEGKRDLME